jgi:hypothetical protein
MTADDGRRPGPLRWLWYAMGGSLGPRYRQWVLHDLSCPGRWLRQIVRAVVQVLPLAVVVLLVLPAGWVTWVGVICGLVLAVIISVAYFDQSADYRLVRHGFPRGAAREIVMGRDAANDPDRMRRYMQTYRDNAS